MSNEWNGLNINYSPCIFLFFWKSFIDLCVTYDSGTAVQEEATCIRRKMPHQMMKVTLLPAGDKWTEAGKLIVCNKYLFFFLSSPVCTICVHTLMRVYFLQSMQFLTWVCIMQSHLHCFFLVIDASNSMQLGQSQRQKLLLCLCFFNAKSQ